MKIRFARPCTRLAGGALLLAGLVGGPLTATQSHAQIGACQTDPIVVLNDGTQLHIKASVSTATTNVQSIIYNLDLPAGASINHVVYTGGSLSGLESIVPSYNLPPGTYETDVFVSSSDKSANAAVNQNLVDNGSTKALVTGKVNQDLTITVQP